LKTNNFTVGDVVKLKRECLGNPIGTYGVGFNDYETGCQFIFENGGLDEFNSEEKIKSFKYQTEQEFFLEFIREEESLQDYEFKNVIQVDIDFRKGLFNRAFRKDL